MSDPSFSKSPSPVPQIEKKIKKKRKSIAEYDDQNALAVSKAEKKLKKTSSKKSIKDSADDDAMAVDGEPDATIESKTERKSKKSKKGKAPAIEEAGVPEPVEGAMDVDEAPEAVTKPSETKADKKLKRKRKDIDEETLQVDEAPASGDESDAGAEAKDAEDDNNDENDENEDAPAVDEPVLSHAERRRRKKEAKLAAKLKAAASEDADADGASATATKKRKLKDGSAKAVSDAKDATNTATKDRKNSVWVGNLSFKTQPENLRTFFDGVGEITRINMPTKPPAGPGMKPENRGYAYVDFATPEAKIIAITLSENPLLGRKLLIKDGDDFTGRPAAIAAEHAITDPALAHKTHSKTAQKILRAQKQPPAPTLFFGNLPFDTTDDTIRELLEAHRAYGASSSKKDKDDDGGGDGDGEEKEKKKEVWIRKVRMGTFEDTGACKGFAFVDFMTIEHATSALINPRNHHLNGRKLVVEYAGADGVRRGAPKGKGDGVFKGSRAARPERAWGGGDKARSHGNAGAREPEYGQEQEQGGEGRAGAGDEDASAEAPSKKRPWEHSETAQLNKDGRHKGPRSRPKPGAALALAKRESTAIVQSQGQKITF